MERNYPALARWIHRIESLPGIRTNLPAALVKLADEIFKLTLSDGVASTPLNSARSALENEGKTK